MQGIYVLEELPEHNTQSARPPATPAWGRSPERPGANPGVYHSVQPREGAAAYRQQPPSSMARGEPTWMATPPEPAEEHTGEVLTDEEDEVS